MINSPSYHHINGQTGFKAFSGLQIPVLDPASTLKSAMIDLDSPTSGIPGEALTGFIEALNFNGGKEHPFQGGCNRLRIIHFTGMNHPDIYSRVSLGFRGLESNGNIAHFKPGFSLQLASFSRNTDYLEAGNWLSAHQIPQIFRLDFPVARSLATDQDLGPIR